MSNRLVSPQLFSLWATEPDWNIYQVLNRYPGYHGPFDVSNNELPSWWRVAGEEQILQLRWLLHADLGLSPRPFKVLRRPRDLGSSATEQDYARQDDWELLEIVGLPVDGDWRDTGYSMDSQGPPDFRLSPVDA